MEWEEIKRTGDVLKIKDYLDKHQESENLDEITAVYHNIRHRLLVEMKENVHRYWSEYRDWIKAGVFTKEELVAEGLLRSEEREDRSQLPGLEQFYAKPNYEAKTDCTDVYFWGNPCSGITGILQGLIGVDGIGCSINFREKGGPYAAALQQYLKAGLDPYSTPGKFLTTINDNIEEKREKNLIINHKINLVEMSGNDFICVSNGRHYSHYEGWKYDYSLKLTDLGDRISTLLRNKNRKVFFIVVDPVLDQLPMDYYQNIFDVNGNRIDCKWVREYFNQNACISKFVDLFEADENKEFMKQVDAMHFIVTKADTLGSTREERNRKALKLLLEKYPGVVYKLVGYLRRNRRINCTTDYQPRIFTFSLGKFYLDGEYDYNNKDSLYLIDALRHMTQGTKEPTGMRKLLGKASSVVQPRPGDYGVKISFDE